MTNFNDVETIYCESGNVLHIVYDEYEVCPVIEYEESWCHIALWTRDYGGTVTGYDSPYDLMGELLECKCGLTPGYSERLANDNIAKAVARCNKQPGLYVLPVYEFSHSSTYLSVNDPHDPWDSGFVGFVYTTRDELKTDGFANITRKNVYQWLEQTLAMYDNWATGNVYGFVLNDADGIEIDSCYGFYPENNYGCIDDYCINEMLSQCGETRADKVGV
jgi:hypothetical protein